MSTSKKLKQNELLENFKEAVLTLDPVYWTEKNLYLDNAPFRISDNGWKPYVDMYRYIGIKSLGKDSKPIVFCKSRQIAGTTTALFIELFFLASGLFGTSKKPPMRVLHCFPQLETAARFSKTKFSSTIATSKPIPSPKNPSKKIPYLESRLDPNASAKDSLSFKQFAGGNHIFIESTGLNADRLRGITCDAILFDECFPGNQHIETINGKKTIGSIYADWKAGKALPLVKTYNESTDEFEYKKIIRAFCNGEKELIQLTCGNRETKCTPNHRFLTDKGWKRADELNKNDLIKTAFKNHGFTVVDKIKVLSKKEIVYDIEVEDNHNFIVTSNGGKNLGGLIAHNCQDTKVEAMNNARKSLTAAQYGPLGEGIQFYFGTPKKRGSDFHKMWLASSQQYFHLGCEKCEKDFPLYTPGSDKWEEIWIEDNLPKEHKDHGFIVKCPHCDREQNKIEATKRGKWVAYNKDEKCKYTGYHLNQLFIPKFNRDKILSEKPENHPTNTERSWQNEVLGEFYSGNSSPLTTEEIDEMCGDRNMTLRPRITSGTDRKVFAGFDWGDKADEEASSEEGGSSIGKSYCVATVLVSNGPHILELAWTEKFSKTNYEYKIQRVDQIMRQFSVDLALGDIGHAGDLSETLQSKYDNRYIAMRGLGNLNKKFTYKEDRFPKTIEFDTQKALEGVFDLFKKGLIKLPYGNFERIAWAIEQYASMDTKISHDRMGNQISRFVKGHIPNDALMSLLYATIGSTFLKTNGFKDMDPRNHRSLEKAEKSLILGGYIKRRI